MTDELIKDQLPPLPGTFTWKRTVRFFSILAAFALFFLIVGLPYLRLGTDSLPNGMQKTAYFGVNGVRELYYKDSEPKPPMIVLLRVWKKSGFSNRGVRYEVRDWH